LSNYEYEVKKIAFNSVFRNLASSLIIQTPFFTDQTKIPNGFSSTPSTPIKESTPFPFLENY